MSKQKSFSQGSNPPLVKEQSVLLLIVIMSNFILILRSENVPLTFVDSLDNLDVYVEKPNKLH